ncbi:dendrin [Theristicus caerulescens]
MAAGCRPAPPLDLPPHRRGVRVPGEALRGGAGPPLAPGAPRSPPAARRTSPPRPPRSARAGHPPPAAPPGQPEGTGDGGPQGRHPPSAPRPPLPGGRLGPPSYEAHMQRVQAAHARRGGPPPYISPPAYDAPHRTLQLRPPRGACSPPPPPRGRRAVPRGWSHTLPRAATEAGHRWPRGTQPSPGGPGTPRHSQTLPRAAAGRERVLGRGRGRRGTGGHVLIDATRVVVRAQYVPPPQRQQVRYAGGSPGPTAPPRSPPAAATPPAAPSPPREPPASPRSPWRSPGGCGGPRGRPPPRRPALYAQALREAVSRIRRHTAPDSDSEAEGGAGGVPVAALPRRPRLQQQQQQPGEHRGPPGGRQPPPRLRGGAWRGGAPSGRGLAGCGPDGAGLGGVWPSGGRGSGLRFPQADPNKGCGIPLRRLRPFEDPGAQTPPGQLEAPGVPAGTAARHGAGGTRRVPRNE